MFSSHDQPNYTKTKKGQIKWHAGLSEAVRKSGGAVVGTVTDVSITGWAISLLQTLHHTSMSLNHTDHEPCQEHYQAVTSLKGPQP
jgi:hypothetical protein